MDSMQNYTSRNNFNHLKLSIFILYKTLLNMNGGAIIILVIFHSFLFVWIIISLFIPEYGSIALIICF